VDAVDHAGQTCQVVTAQVPKALMPELRGLLWA
jgi:hypothetical protein